MTTSTYSADHNVQLDTVSMQPFSVLHLKTHFTLEWQSSVRIYSGHFCNLKTQNQIQSFPSNNIFISNWSDFFWFHSLRKEVTMRTAPFMDLVKITGEGTLGSERPALFLAMTRNSYSLPSVRPSTVALLSGVVVSTPWTHTHTQHNHYHIICGLVVRGGGLRALDTHTHTTQSLPHHLWPCCQGWWSPRPGHTHNTITTTSSVALSGVVVSTPWPHTHTYTHTHTHTTQSLPHHLWPCCQR